MCKILVFDEVFFFLAMIIVYFNFSSFCSNHCKGNKYFHHAYAAYQSKLFPKKKSQTEKGYSKKLPQRGFFYPIIKDTDPNFQTLTNPDTHRSISWILLPLIIYLVVNDLLNLSCFS